jgi:hypothetical protein
MQKWSGAPGFRLLCGLAARELRSIALGWAALAFLSPPVFGGVARLLWGLSDGPRQSQFAALGVHYDDDRHCRRRGSGVAVAVASMITGERIVIWSVVIAIVLLALVLMLH